MVHLLDKNIYSRSDYACMSRSELQSSSFAVCLQILYLSTSAFTAPLKLSVCLILGSSLGKHLTLARTSAYRCRRSLVLKLAMLAFCPLRVRLDTIPEGGGGGGAGAGVAWGGGGETPNVTPVEFDDTGPPSSVTGTCLLPENSRQL